MEMQPDEVYRALTKRGVRELHHANTVRTSRHFLREGALLSRGTVERRGWDQTPQDTDEKDKTLGIWFDIFLDTGGIHGLLQKRANVYGPVLFVFDVEILREPLTGGAWVTQKNPCYWRKEHAWFPALADWEADFRPPSKRGGWWEHMLVLRHCGGELPFGLHLKKLILDDPGIGDHHNKAHAALTSAMAEGSLDIPIEKRQCGSCGCRGEYETADPLLDVRFGVG
jgi:hypothetical protein